MVEPMAEKVPLAAAYPAVDLGPGVTVRVCGLRSTAELNGVVGTCLQWNAEKARWRVRMPGGGAKLFRAQNLAVAKPVIALAPEFVEAPWLGTADEGTPLEAAKVLQDLPAEMIRVLVRHAISGVEVAVEVPQRAKFKHVKKAVAKLTGDDAILRTSEFVWKSGSVYKGYRDAAFVGDARELLIANVNFDGLHGQVARLCDSEISDPDESTEPSRRSGEAVEARAREKDVRQRAEEEDQLLQHLTATGYSPSRAFQLLQVDPGATEAEITRQYRRFSLMIHPDKCSSERASAAFQVLVKAYNQCMARRRHPSASSTAEAEKPSVEGGLAREQAIKLLRDLYEAFTTDDFQRKLEALELQKDLYSGSADFQKDRQKLFLTVHSQVLPRFGFEGSQSGLYKMLGQMGPYTADEDFAHWAQKINGLLGVNFMPKQWDRMAVACRKQAETGGQLRKAIATSSGSGYACLPLFGSLKSGPLASLEQLAKPGRQPSSMHRKAVHSKHFGFSATKAPSFQLFVAGSWNSFAPEPMRWQEGLFRRELLVGNPGQERFQLLRDGSLDNAFFPDVPDAPRSEGAHVQGPSDQGHDVNWLIETHASVCVMIIVAIDSLERVVLVDWNPTAPGSAKKSGVKAATQPKMVSGRPGCGYVERKEPLDKECLLPWELEAEDEQVTLEESHAWSSELDQIGA